MPLLQTVYVFANSWGKEDPEVHNFIALMDG